MRAQPPHTNIYFVSGIDTDAGKSIATGWLAREWNVRGIRTVTQKFIQTGGVAESEDIRLHRKIMGTPLSEDDRALVMPEIFSYPASPHLAAKIDRREIDLGKITTATNALAAKYDAVLVEGAGGLMVPIRDDLLTIDYVHEKQYPVIFVTSGKLGSISHTLLALDALKRRGMTLHTLIYNRFPQTDAVIANDTEAFLRNALRTNWPTAEFAVLPILSLV